MTEKLQLTKSDRQKVWWRSTFLQGSWNYERMQNLGWAYSLIPAIKRLYTKKEDQAAALERHLEFFNTHPYVAAPILGVTLALEEEKANGASIDDAAIQGVKIGMMGPLAGIGDPVFWFTVRPILGALGASLAASGNIIGPLLFFVLWNAIRMAFLWYTQELGYKAGSEITKDMSGGILQDITKGASILGMFIIGVLVKQWVNIGFKIALPSTTLTDPKAYVEIPNGPVTGTARITLNIPLYVVIEEKSFTNHYHRCIIYCWYCCSLLQYYVIKKKVSAFFFLWYNRKRFTLKEQLWRNHKTKQLNLIPLAFPTSD